MLYVEDLYLKFKYVILLTRPFSRPRTYSCFMQLAHNKLSWLIYCGGGEGLNWQECGCKKGYQV